MPAESLFNVASEFLAACSEALVDTPGGEIHPQLISVGVPAWDCCPMLAVHVIGPQIAETSPSGPMLQPGHRIQTTGTVNLVAMTATVLRCVATVKDAGKISLPAAAELTADAQIAYADLWAIWNHLKTKWRAGELFEGLCREFTLDQAIPVLTQGGCGGWTITVRVSMEGYESV